MRRLPFFIVPAFFVAVLVGALLFVPGGSRILSAEAEEGNGLIPVHINWNNPPSRYPCDFSANFDPFLPVFFRYCDVQKSVERGVGGACRVTLWINGNDAVGNGVVKKQTRSCTEEDKVTLPSCDPNPAAYRSCPLGYGCAYFCSEHPRGYEYCKYYCSLLHQNGEYCTAHRECLSGFCNGMQNDGHSEEGGVCREILHCDIYQNNPFCLTDPYAGTFLRCNSQVDCGTAICEGRACVVGDRAGADSTDGTADEALARARTAVEEAQKAYDDAQQELREKKEEYDKAKQAYEESRNAQTKQLRAGAKTAYNAAKAEVRSMKGALKVAKSTLKTAQKAAKTR